MPKGNRVGTVARLYAAKLPPTRPGRVAARPPLQGLQLAAEAHVRVTAWNNGDWHPSGAGYGIKIRRDDGDQHFQSSWRDVRIQLEGNGTVTVRLSTSFWNACKELRKKEIGNWIQAQGFSSWPSRQPPHFELTPVGDRNFKLSIIPAMTNLGTSAANEDREHISVNKKGILSAALTVLPAAPAAASRPNPEVAAPAKRRTFTAEYKQRILAEVDAVKVPGTIGALLRREGLCSSHLVTWRREREAGIRYGLTPRKRGPKLKSNPLEQETKKLRRENQRLTEELRRVKIVIAARKPPAAILSRPIPAPDHKEKP